MLFGGGKEKTFQGTQYTPLSIEFYENLNFEIRVEISLISSV